MLSLSLSFSCTYHHPLLIIIVEDPNPNAVTSKREADGFISDTENMAIAPRKRRRRIVTSSEEEDSNDDDDDDDDHNPATATSPFSDMQELTPTPDWDDDDDDDDSDEKNGELDTFEELSEGEERRRRVGNSADPDDFRYLDPELYGLRRSARRTAAVSNAQRKHKSYVCTTLISCISLVNQHSIPHTGIVIIRRRRRGGRGR